uniref:Uncharacterized protein n=1 Tax=Mucochytrium quahogii TaxID=96639 RepID=A0A7S2RRW4_9STRA|mmetsp:Transcript_7426/g.11941  ORF Transcript_7426/g.11941 Transcript_7426/m.11941 type:complete len:120 (-) Transcript_7426:1333-1692(-)
MSSGHPHVVSLVTRTMKKGMPVVETNEEHASRRTMKKGLPVVQIRRKTNTRVYSELMTVTERNRNVATVIGFQPFKSSRLRDESRLGTPELVQNSFKARTRSLGSSEAPHVSELGVSQL